MSLSDITPVTLKSRMIDGGTREMRPINNYVVVEREPATRMFGVIIGVASDGSFDVQLSKVLSISDKVKCNTRKGPLKVGDRVLSVKVVNRRVEDIDLRTEDNNKIGLLDATHCLAVVTDVEILPCNDLILVSAQPDSRMVGSLVFLGNDSLDMHSSKIISTGPDVEYGEPGMYSAHPKVNGVAIDSAEIRRKFGHNLKLIREKSTHAVSTEKLEDDPSLENNPDFVPPQVRGLN